MTTENHFEPTLFILLGTSAGQVGWRLKELIRQAYGDVPVLRFLWVDADSTIDPNIVSWFSAAERVELTGFNGDAVLANLRSFPTIRAWWPRESRLRAGFINHGAGQMRPVGRLALFRMFNDRNSGPAFIDKLRQAVESIQQIDNIDATERMSRDGMKFVVERIGVRVVLVFSSCGGTGSSMAFDVAYLCRHLLRDLNPTVMAVTILPSIIDKAIKNDAPNQRVRIRANTYAWFKETNHLLENPVWRVAYPEGAPLNVQAPPFDLNFVVELGNQAGNRLRSEDDIYSMIASAIFLDTGSSIGGAMRGFNANVGVLLDEFQGRRRAFSSLAAASLIYPADKIVRYCAARLGQAMLRSSALASPDSGEVLEAAASLIGRLHLRDDQVLEDLLSSQQVSGLNIPAIRKAPEVEDLRRLLAQQEESNDREREIIKDRMAEKIVSLTNQACKGLEREIAALALQRGARFAQAVLKELIAESAGNSVMSANGASLNGCKARIVYQGVSETDLALAGQEYQRAQARLRAMSGDVLRAAQKLLFRKAWLEALNRVRNDCLAWMGEVNQRNLQLQAHHQTVSLYDELVEDVRRLYLLSGNLVQTLERTAECLEDQALDALKPSTLEQGVYELSAEAVDGEYIRNYYLRQSASLSGETCYQAFARQLVFETLPAMIAWDDFNWADRVHQHARQYFAGNIAQTSLIQALAEYHGDRAPQVIEEKFDRLVRYCHPFWQYDTNSGIQGQEGKSIIGIEDENSPLIPKKYHEDPQYEIKSTGFKHRVDFARVQHGLPAFLLHDMADYRACYEEKRKGLDPLHVFPEAFLAGEVIPEEKQEARSTFAVAAAFGYVIQVGSFYYFDPQKEYTAKNIRPVRENRLEQGREKAEDAFVSRDDLVQWGEQLVERDIVNMGNQAAIRLLDGKIEEYKEGLSKMPPDGDLRRQYEDEIRAMLAKQQQLGML